MAVSIKLLTSHIFIHNVHSFCCMRRYLSIYLKLQNTTQILTFQKETVEIPYTEKKKRQHESCATAGSFGKSTVVSFDIRT